MRREELGTRWRRVRRSSDGRQRAVIRVHRATSSAIVEIVRPTSELAVRAAMCRRCTRARHTGLGACVAAVMVAALVTAVRHLRRRSQRRAGHGMLGHRGAVRHRQRRQRGRDSSVIYYMMRHVARDLSTLDPAMNQESVENESDHSPAETHHAECTQAQRLCLYIMSTSSSYIASASGSLARIAVAAQCLR